MEEEQEEEEVAAEEEEEGEVIPYEMKFFLRNKLIWD